MTISFPIIIRDTAAAAEARYGELLAANGTPDMGNGPVLLGSPDLVADAIRPYRDSASRPSSSGCPRRTTVRRSTG